ncbi:hypothetical protein [Actibacterium pelagium]|uniref:Uncharacterized protein n=1 Tax=Actibacterium pelagium TaxID=2029103 RepID=A0A917EKQ5_9RHOB|nr:hypothetical protein [Actibacterium pelagium]GGE57849.1 hypothetical protein GCM10011517_27060 [Actibacterium pelagium]
MFYLLVFTALICFGVWAVGKPEYAKLGLFTVSLIALFIGGCGFLFSGAAVLNWDGWSSGILLFSLPSGIIGTLIGWFGWRKFKRTMGTITDANGMNPQLVGKVGFEYRGKKVDVEDDFYCFDGKNFESVTSVKEYIDSILPD